MRDIHKSTMLSVRVGTVSSPLTLLPLTSNAVHVPVSLAITITESSIKILHITLTLDLRWHYHVAELTSSVSRAQNIMAKSLNIQEFLQ